MMHRCTGRVRGKAGQFEDGEIRRVGGEYPPHARIPENGSRADHFDELVISSNKSSSGEGKGRRTAPTELEVKLLSDARSTNGDRRATGRSDSTMSNSPCVASRSTVVR